MKKKSLNGLSLNKKSIANFSNKVGGNNEVPAPTLYAGCVDSNAACESGRCITGAQCEIESIFCTNYQCQPVSTVFPIC